MEQYISKSALIAEIEKRIKTNKECMLGLRNLNYYQGKAAALYDTISLLNTLEAKEVDLDKEVSAYMNNEMKFLSDEVGYDTLLTIAKHFFELGLNVSNPLTWEDMMVIHKCIKDAMNYNLYAWETVEGQQKIYKDVLKRFKAQKGE